MVLKRDDSINRASRVKSLRCLVQNLTAYILQLLFFVNFETLLGNGYLCILSLRYVFFIKPFFIFGIHLSGFKISPGMCISNVSVCGKYVFPIHIVLLELI